MFSENKDESGNAGAGQGLDEAWARNMNMGTGW